MPRISFLHTLPHTAVAFFSAIVCTAALCGLTATSAQAQVTLLVPSQPSIEAPAKHINIVSEPIPMPDFDAPREESPAEGEEKPAAGEDKPSADADKPDQTQG